jgi:hypothetical protein
MNQAIEQLINLNKIKTRDIKSRRELWKDKVYYLENNPYWDKNTCWNLPIPSTFHRIQQELKKVVAKQQAEIKNPNCHILEHTSENLVFCFFPDPPVFENLKDFLWTTGNNVWYETEKWERTRLHVVVYAKKEKILAGYMRWLCSAWQGVIHASPLLTTTAPLIPWNMTDYDEVCMCPSVLNASKTVEFTFKLPFKYALWGERKITKKENRDFLESRTDEFTQRLIKNSLITLKEEDETKAELVNLNSYEPWEEVTIGKHDWRFFLIHEIENNENNIPESSHSIKLPLNEWINTIDLGSWLEQMELVKKYSHYAKHISFQFWWKGKPVSPSYPLTDLDLAKMLFIAIGNPAGISYQIKSGRVNVFWRENCSYNYSVNPLLQAKTDLLRDLLIGGLSGIGSVITGGGSLALASMAKSAMGATATYQNRVISSLLDGSGLGMEQMGAWEFALNWKEPLLTMKIEFNNQQFNQYKRERAFKTNGNKWETTDAVAKILNHPGRYRLVTFSSEWDTPDKYFTNLFREGVNLYKENPRENFNPDLLPSFTEVNNLEVDYSRNVAVTVVDFTDTKVEGSDEDIEYDERSWILQKSFLRDTVTGKDYLPELVKSRPTTGGEVNSKKSDLLTKYPEDIWNPNGDYMQAYCDRDIPSHPGGYEGREARTTYTFYDFVSQVGSPYVYTYDTYGSRVVDTKTGYQDVYVNRKGNSEKSGTKSYTYNVTESYKTGTDSNTYYWYYVTPSGSGSEPRNNYISGYPSDGKVSWVSSTTSYKGVYATNTEVISEGVYHERTFAKPAAWKFGAGNQWRSEPIELTKGHQHSCAVYGWSTEGGNGQEKLIFQAEESGEADAWTATLIQNGATWTVEFNKATYITEVKKTVDAWTEQDREAYEEMRKEWQKEQEEQRVRPDFFDTTAEQLKPQPELKLKEQEEQAQEEFQEFLRQQEAARATQQEQLRQRQQEIEAEQKKDRERLASRSRSKRNWKNISLEFTDELQSEWEELGFSYEQAQDWINTGFKVGDAEFVAWLEQNSFSQETILNELNSDDLRQLHETFEGEKKESGERRKPKGKEKGDGGEREN